MCVFLSENYKPVILVGPVMLDEFVEWYREQKGSQHVSSTDPSDVSMNVC